MRNATGTFRIGNMEVFQDKPSKELQLALEYMHNKERERALEISDIKIFGLALQLKDKTEAEISIVLKSIVRRINYYKEHNKDCNVSEK